MTKGARLLAGAAALAVLALYLTPYLAVQRMRAAAAAQDGPALAALVDVPAVRDSLKTGLRDRFVGTAPSPATVMGAEVAGALLGPMVDALITPDSLARVLQGQPPGAAIAPQPVDTQMGYESPSRFVVRIKPIDSDDEPVELVLKRDGLWRWKLAGLRLS